MAGRSTSQGGGSGSNPPWSPDRSESESFGSWLMKERKARSIELEQIAEHTKISVRILEALEHDDRKALPASVFVRGFLRQYARFVGMDAEQVVSFYSGLDDSRPEREPPRRSSKPESGPRLWPSVVIGVVVLAAGAGYWFYGRSSDAATEVKPGASAEAALGSQPDESPRSAVRDNDPRSPAVSPQGPPIQVTIDFVEDCWVESSVDGRRQISTLYAKGESLRLNGQESVRIFLGNYSGAEVHINGHAYSWPDTAGRDGTSELEIDAAFVAALTGVGGGSDEAAPIS